ncbi:MAG: GWxTD domain-containing protein, partial [Candidatus Marinimicrobia bacterium]|nr:GWxTD domain-containing protein [Candidatus Neomarinimicrobiota bacterium]
MTLRISNIILLVSALFGNNLDSEGDLTMFLDSYQYDGTNDSTIVELSYSIDLSYLNYIDIDNQFQDLQLSIKVESIEGEIILDKTYDIDRESIKNSTFNYIGLQRFSTIEDTVKINLIFMDSFLKHHSQINGLLPIDKYGNSPSLSDIMLVQSIDKSEANSIYSKGGLNLIPLVNRTIDINDDKKTIYIYYQLNNIFFSENDESWYLPRYEIIGVDGNVITISEADSVLKSASNSARIEVIKKNELKVGKYLLNIIIKDLTTGDVLTTSKIFNVTDKPFGKNQLLPMSKNDIKKYQNQIKYIATYEEKKLFKKLSNEGKQNFIIDFWSKRDPDLSTEKNEFLIEHFNRLNYCELNIKGGIDSDMG